MKVYLLMQAETGFGEFVRNVYLSKQIANTDVTNLNKNNQEYRVSYFLKEHMVTKVYLTKSKDVL